MDEDTRTMLAGLARLTDEELLARLAFSLFGDERGAFPQRDRLRRAEAWVDRFLDAQRESICADPRVVVLLAEEHDELEEVAVLADVLASLAGTPKSVPIATVALIVARRGLRRLCG